MSSTTAKPSEKPKSKSKSKKLNPGLALLLSDPTIGRGPRLDAAPRAVSGSEAGRGKAATPSRCETRGDDVIFPSAWAFAQDPSLARAAQLAMAGRELEAPLWRLEEPNCNAAAIAKYEESIATCDFQVQAYYYLAMLLLRTSQSDNDIDRVLELLRRAAQNYCKFIIIPIPWSQQPCCADEIAAGKLAQQRLALLLLQQRKPGVPLAECPTYLEAKGIMKRMGYSHRLSDEVLLYDSLRDYDLHSPPEGEDPGSSEAKIQGHPEAKPTPNTLSHDNLFALVDRALPQSLLTRLQSVFAPSSVFWRAHGYGTPGQGYFSYVYPLDTPPRSFIEQVIQHLYALARARYPAAKEATKAEWWVHSRSHSYGHQMHFDSDDEGRNGIRHPIVGSILYVTGECGGATLMTNQTLRGSALANKGWLIAPRTNRYMMFDGQYLHGVLPGLGAAPPELKSDAAQDADSEPMVNPDQKKQQVRRRMTLMVAFWKDIKIRPRPACGRFGSAMAWPGYEVEGGRTEEEKRKDAEWLEILEPMPSQPFVQPGSFIVASDAAVAGTQVGRTKFVEKVWERVDENLPDVDALPPYERCFQGM